MKLNNSIHININDRVEISDKIYSIDPEGCEDADDAFSIYKSWCIFFSKKSAHPVTNLIKEYFPFLFDFK